MAMKRRLYFLLPDTAHASGVVQELERHGIERSHIHAIAGQGIDPGDLPMATLRQRGDAAAGIEKFLWLANLAAFFISLLLLIVMMLLQPDWLWLLLPLGVMLVCFIAGLGFTSRVPNVHLDEFRDAMRHAEVLLMVDVPVKQVARVEALLHRHPEVTVGGVGWNIAHLSV
jgi:hypothetical protein